MEIRRLKLDRENAREIEHWKSAMAECSFSEPVTLSPELLDALQAIVDRGGWDVNWWANRLLFINLFGRAFMEQVDPIIYKRPSKRQPSFNTDFSVRISSQLFDQIKKQAGSVDHPLSTVIAGSLSLQIFGYSNNKKPEENIDFGASDDDSIKIWLPSIVHHIIKALAFHWGSSTSDVLRNFLLESLIGRLGYMDLLAKGVWNPIRRTSSAYYDAGIMFSKKQVSNNEPARRTARISDFGKSTSDIKLWCPGAMHQELSRVAHIQGLRISDYARTAIIHYVFGLKRRSLILTK